MKKILYTKPDGGVVIITPAPKAHLERVLGILTQEEYEQHVYDRCVPDNALNIREIDDLAIPATREFRNAWCDVSDAHIIDIDLDKARNIKLAELRLERNKKLDELDKETIKALGSKNDLLLDAIELKKQDLRDITEPLKALKCEGHNDPVVLDKIRALGKL